jgi:hypothetical protein
VIFTCYALMYVRDDMPRVIEHLASLRPRLVVHLEPCYEHSLGGHLLDLMRRRYIEFNHYNTDLVSTLRGLDAAGHIQVREEQPNLVGFHPLLTGSLITWSAV